MKGPHICHILVSESSPEGVFRRGISLWTEEVSECPEARGQPFQGEKYCGG